MKICLLSDSHNQHKYLTENILDNKPDMIIHAGDCTNSRNIITNRVELESFLGWYSGLDIKYKILTPGNHDICLERDKRVPDGIYLLINSECTIEDIKIWGSPYTPTFGSNEWAFTRKRSKMQDVWNLIPDNLDILICHGMPKTILDLATDPNTGEIVQVGCNNLLKRVFEVKIKSFMIGGHLHSNPSKQLFNNGTLIRNGVTFINASIVMDHSSKLNLPKYITL
jgi:predicted phosphodiesterase